MEIRMHSLKKILKFIRKIAFYLVMRTSLIFSKKVFLIKENDLLESLWQKKKISCYSKKPREYRNRMDLSLIVPVYNSEKFVRKLVESLGGQRTKYSYEVIFIDDGSTDKSFEILTKYTRKYLMMRILRQKRNGGVSRARNAGLEIANGKYIGFIDSDDFIRKDYVEKMMSLAYKENADIVKCGDADIRGEKIISRHSRPDEKIIGKMGERILNYPSYAWAAVYKSELLKNIYFPDSYWYEDMIVRFLLYRKSMRFVNIKDVLYYRTSHDNQITKLMPTSRSAQCLEHLYLIEQLVEDNKKSDLGNDVYLYLNVLLECSNVMVGRVDMLDDDAKKQVFARAHKLLTSLYKDEYSKYLKSEWRLKNDIILKRRYDLWKMEKNL